MKYKSKALEVRHQQIACWLNGLLMSSAATYDLLRDQVQHLAKAGDRTIAQNMLAKRAAEANSIARHHAHNANVKKIHDEKLQAWLASLPAGAKYAASRRGGYVAVVDGTLISTLKNGAADFEVSGKFIESPKRQLLDVPCAALKGECHAN